MPQKPVTPLESEMESYTIKLMTLVSKSICVTLCRFGSSMTVAAHGSRTFRMYELISTSGPGSLKVAYTSIVYVPTSFLSIVEMVHVPVIWSNDMKLRLATAGL